MLPRRYLPSLSLLTAFEAAARLGSFTRAAEELDLTQGAISRQVRALEEQLGARLFRRERQRVHLTPQGRAYADEVRRGLRLIGNASLSLATNPEGGTLSLAILPTFGTRWLAPRLPGFLAANPGVTLTLSTRLEMFDMEAEQIDAAIHFGHDDWPGARAAFLMEEEVIPCAAPALLARLALRAPADLLRAPLLTLDSRPRAWARWLEAQGVAGSPPRGMVFDQFATMAQAAAGGLGLALLPRALMQAELSSGALVPAFDRAVASHGGYWLVWPEGREGYPPLERFRHWLLGQRDLRAASPDAPGNDFPD
ncbi:MAG: LysR family transcriptional regulator [Rhodobacteraceae bacterium]|nr:LysR family transcriptional regulator [Paracoccaceae bacterium]